MLAGVVQAQPRAHAGFRENGRVLVPGGSGEDSKVRPAFRRGYQRHHLLRALSGRRDIYIIRGHVVPAGNIPRSIIGKATTFDKTLVDKIPASGGSFTWPRTNNDISIETNIVWTPFPGDRVLLRTRDEPSCVHCAFLTPDLRPGPRAEPEIPRAVFHRRYSLPVPGRLHRVLLLPQRDPRSAQAERPDGGVARPHVLRHLPVRPAQHDPVPTAREHDEASRSYDALNRHQYVAKHRGVPVFRLPRLQQVPERLRHGHQEPADAGAVSVRLSVFTIDRLQFIADGEL